MKTRNATRVVENTSEQSIKEMVGCPVLSAFRDTNDDGTAYNTVAILDVRGKDIEEIKARIHEEYPAEHCQHSHDCCGHWYNGTAEIHELTSAMIAVVLYRSCNV